MLNRLLLFFSLFFIANCTHSVHLVHVGDFKPYQKQTSGKKIEARAEQTVFLGFTLETNYVDLARSELMQKCPKGDIQGPVSRLSTSHGFFSWTNKLYVQALCVTRKSSL